MSVKRPHASVGSSAKEDRSQAAARSAETDEATSPMAVVGLEREGESAGEAEDPALARRRLLAAAAEARMARLAPPGCVPTLKGEIDIGLPV